MKYKIIHCDNKFLSLTTGKEKFKRSTYVDDNGNKYVNFIKGDELKKFYKIDTDEIINYSIGNFNSIVLTIKGELNNLVNFLQKYVHKSYENYAITPNRLKV